ncbi:MAG: glycosyltransferase family 2 protein [Planctomycetes bacterium]|nr:glycosyltransferase family 2 protein [Planctomycetota bacterium]
MSDNLAIGAGPGVPNLVSVVIPTYNRADLLGRAIQSVLDQTHTEVEALVVDDGSTDHTREVVARFTDPRVRYFHQANAGVSAARNTGLLAARGEFIALLDSDDAWLPWKLRAQVAFLRRFPEAGNVWTEMSAIDETGTIVAPRYLRTYYNAYTFVTTDEVFAKQNVGAVGRDFPEVPAEYADERYYVGNIFRYMILGNLIHTSTVLMRRERLRQVGGFDVTLPVTGEDYDFHLRTTSFGPVGYMNVPSILYRIGSTDQLSSAANQLHIARNNLLTLERGLARAGDRSDLPRRLINRRFAESHSWIGREELRAGDRQAARRHLGASLRYKPLQPATAAQFALSILPSDLTRAAYGVWHGLKALRQPRPVNA